MFFPVIILSFGTSALVRQWMSRTYAKWSKVANRADVNGHTVTRQIMDASGLSHIKLEISEGNRI